jgi:hypothetical protein
MAETPIDGEGMRKQLKKSRNMPIAFGFNPGTADDDDELLYASARKPAELLGKTALQEGAGTRSAFGSFRLDGSEVHLTCFRTLPGLAKKFKKLLRGWKIALNVVVLDPAGNVIDSDIEVLDGTWAPESGAADADLDVLVDDEEDGAAAAPAAPAAVPPGPEAAALLGRLRALQPGIVAAPLGAAEKLMAAFRAAAGMVKAGQVAPATTTIGMMEAILAKLAAAGQTRAGGAAPMPAGQTPPAPRPLPPPAGAADPRLPRLREAAETLAAQAGALLGPGAGPIRGDLARIAGRIDAGDTEAALSGLKAVQAAVAAARAARDRWDKAFAALAPEVARALSQGRVADPDGLRTTWDAARALAGSGAWERALAALPAVVAILKAGAGAATFETARLRWADARSRMLAEAERRATATAGTGADDADGGRSAAAARDLLAAVQAIDGRLQDLLDRIAGAEPGPARDALRGEARGVLGDFRAILAARVSPEAGDGPSAPAGWIAGARRALEEIDRTLS